MIGLCTLVNPGANGRSQVRRERAVGLEEI